MSGHGGTRDNHGTENSSSYAAFWLFQRRDTWRQASRDSFDDAAREWAAVLDNASPDITIRGVYSSLGLSADIDLILWAHAPRVEQLQMLFTALDKTTIGSLLALRHTYIGVGGMSQYDPTHGPAFVKGVPPKRYLSVYPFSKTPDWYLIDYQERRRLMVEHGEMGREFPEILTNTVNSFGIQDQEFVVALEDDDPHQLIRMVQRLRAAEVRKWTALDVPIFLGDRKEPCAALDDLRGA